MSMLLNMLLRLRRCLLTEGWGRFKPRLKNQSWDYFYIKLDMFGYEIAMKWNPRNSKIGKNHQKTKILGKSCIWTGYLQVVRRTLYHSTIFKPEPCLKKTFLYTSHTQFIEQIGWSGKWVEQESGISHIFNLSNFESLGFQILVIWDL